MELYGIACALAYLVALCARQDGYVLRVGATVLGGNWLLFAMPWIYAPAAPAFALEVSNLDAWALTDLISMVMIGWAGRDTYWSPALWGPYLITLSMFAIAWVSGLPYVDYKFVLDAALTIQLAVIFAIGGGDCADYLSDLWRTCRLRILGDGPGSTAAASRLVARP